MDQKIIIFDMDGVIFDSIGFARSIFMQRRPGVTKEMYDELHSGNYHEEAAKYSHLKENVSDEEKKAFLEQYAAEKSKVGIFEGVREMLAELHDAGRVIVLNTNAYEQNCLPLLENADIKKFFSFIAHAGISKDKIQKFEIIQKMYGANKKDMIFITDALGDVEDAEKAGVNTIAVTYGVHGKSFFERSAHPFLIGLADTVQDLRDQLNSWASLVKTD